MGRKLRKNTRKNYSKMADEDSENGDVENGGERLPIADVNKATTADDEAHDNNGDIINNELFLHDDSDGDDDTHVHADADDSADPSSSSDDEIKNAEKTLKEIKKEQKKLMKKAKLERIAKETKEAQKLLKKLKCGGGKVKEKKEINVASLRAMGDVVEEVDKLMEKKKLKAKQVADTSSDSSSSDSSSSSSESSDTEKKEEKKEKKISGKHSHRSGKSKRLTSKVKYPQEWPQSNLSLHFVNREKKYEDLTLAEFCAGYSSILKICGKDTRKHRVSHLEELMYLATKYQWRCILNYHAACLLEIERGHCKWGDSFQTLQSTTLAGGFLHGGSGAPRSGNGSKDEGAGNVFCPGYNRGTCQQSRDHYGQLRGENRLLKHMCAKCWLRTKKVVNHPENSDSCPLKDES